MFPVETVEKILSFCDGKTLFCASNVNENWKKSVQYLTQKTNIWKYCCLEEIPEYELLEYQEKFAVGKTKEFWLEIYENWVSWQDIDRNLRFETILCLIDVPRISCIAVSGRFIAVGSEDGRVKIFNQKWDLLCVERYLAVKVTEIKFICDDDRKDYLTDMYMLIAYKCCTLHIVDYHVRSRAPLVVYDVLLHSIYKTYACFVKRGGRISIVKLGTDPDTNVVTSNEITFIRIYSPNEVTLVKMWKGICTFLINNDVKIVRYDNNIPPISTVENKTSLKFCLNNHYKLQRICDIIRNNLIISISDDEVKGQVMEVFLLGTESSCSKKMFNTWEIFRSNITCTFVYGNTFLIGVDSGNVYFYNINSWKEFDIRSYQHKIIVGKHPIISIDVKETRGERVFYIATTVNIYKVIGYSVSKCYNF